MTAARSSSGLVLPWRPGSPGLQWFVKRRTHSPTTARSFGAPLTFAGGAR